MNPFLFAVVILAISIISVAVLYALFVIVSSLFINTAKEHKHFNRFFYAVEMSACKVGLTGAGVRLKVEGKDKILPQTRYVFVGNHRSNFDPIVTWWVFRKNRIAFISKKENFSIPFFGKMIRCTCCMDINREDPREALKTVNQAAQLMKDEDISVGVYPEGRRVFDGNLADFHDGVFKIAQRACAPIAVIALDGTERIHKNFPFRHTVVRLVVADVISSQEVSEMTTHEISARVREKLETSL